MIKRLYTFLFLLIGLVSNAQDAEMADSFRQEGKIYVVIGVMAIVFLAVIIYIAVIDRKLRKLEDDLKNKK